MLQRWTDEKDITSCKQAAKDRDMPLVKQRDVHHDSMRISWGWKHAGGRGRAGAKNVCLNTYKVERKKHRRDTEDGEKQDEMTSDWTIHQWKHQKTLFSILDICWLNSCSLNLQESTSGDSRESVTLIPVLMRVSGNEQIEKSKQWVLITVNLFFFNFSSLLLMLSSRLMLYHRPFFKMLQKLSEEGNIFLTNTVKLKPAF